MSGYDELPDGVLRLDAGAVILEANAVARQFLGGDLIGQSLGDACEPRTPTGVALCEHGLSAAARLRSVTRIVDQPVVVRTPDGDSTVQVAGSYLRAEDGQLLGALLSLRPPARRSHPVANPIEIVSTVSHELRSPLTSVKGYTSLLLNRWDRLKDDQKKMMLEQVLTNLVENACKYASPTGLRIEVELGAGCLVVSVADRGEGISAADLPQVFRKFFRRDLSKPTGTGLGLWISRGLVEAHGGRLTASSSEGVGTTFTFTLPLVELEEILARG